MLCKTFDIAENFPFLIFEITRCTVLFRILRMKFLQTYKEEYLGQNFSNTLQFDIFLNIKNEMLSIFQQHNANATRWQPQVEDPYLKSYFINVAHFSA